MTDRHAPSTGALHGPHALPDAVRRRISPGPGRRAAVLAVFAAMGVGQGLSLFHPLPEQNANALDHVFALAPPAFWGVLWITLAVASAAIAVLRPPIDRFGFGMQYTIWTLWATAWLWSTARGTFGIGPHIPRGYTVTVLYFAYSAILLIVSGWAENRQLLPDDAGRPGWRARWPWRG